MMVLAENGPFLGESEVDAMLVGAGQLIVAINGIENVLYDTSLLVVGFFDEEGVVADTVDVALGRARQWE